MQASVVVECGLSSSERGHIVAAHGLSCPEASGIFQNQGLNLCPLPSEADS